MFCADEAVVLAPDGLLGPNFGVPAVAVAELLVAQVAAKLGADARKRIDRTEALWTSTGTFID